MKTLLTYLLLFAGYNAMSQVYVTNLNDAGVGSLRHAIDNAIAGETILFNPALTGGTIVLSSSLTPSTDITINGEDKDIKIDGNSSVRIFDIFSGSNFYMQHITLLHGNASEGAGIFATSGTNLNLDDITIRDCNVTNDGAAIKVQGGSHNFMNIEFVSNSAGAFGGAFHSLNATTYFENCLFSGNLAGEGGAAYFRGSTDVVNCTFSGNFANNLGGALYVYTGSTIDNTNCIYWNNSVGGTFGTQQCFFEVDNGPVASISMNNNSCDIEGSGGTAAWNAQFGNNLGNNLDVDPLFIDMQAPALAPTVLGDYRVNHISGTINVGFNPLVTTSFDLDGNNRIHNAQVDLGAYENCTNTGFENVNVCHSYTSPSGNHVYTASGTYFDTLSNVFGCDSIIQINLSVNNTFNTFSVSECGSYTVPSGNAVIMSSQTVNDTIPNSNSCDSILTIIVTIDGGTTSTINPTACASYTVPSGDETYTVDGTYKDTIPNSVGCDSVITINLDILNSYNTINVTECDSFVSPSGSNTYYTSGTYSDVLQNAALCDSIITINLTINNSNSSTITEFACDSYTVPSGHETYTTSGVYEDTLTNISGCDSIITINLTVNNNNSSFLNEVACDFYVGPAGNTYTSSGQYFDTISNVAGCDSVITINLAIGTETTASIGMTGCDSLVSPSGNYTYFADGTFMDTIPNSLGCDSVITLNVTIKTTSFASLTESACDFYMVPSGTAIYSTSGTYQDTIQNVWGCDSVLTIDLTINTASSGSTVETHCNSYTSPSGLYTWTNSGVYQDTILNAAGCDSVITIDLTLLYTTSTIDTAACDYYHSPSGKIWNASGTYTDTLLNSIGCDSVITVNLLINGIDATASSNGLTLTADNIGDAYFWQSCDSTIVVSQNNLKFEFTPVESGHYQVIVSSFGCSDTSECIYVDIPVEAVTSFSPNGDGVNDFLVLDLPSFQNTVIIYNRWGDEIRTFKDYDNVHVVWDGTDLFGKVMTGTYFYVIEDDVSSVGWVFISH